MQAQMQAMLDEDSAECHKMKAAPGGAKDTLTTATAKAVAAGFDLKSILAAALSGYISGGLSGAIAAVLALLVPKP